MFGENEGVLEWRKKMKIKRKMGCESGLVSGSVWVGRRKKNWKRKWGSGVCRCREWSLWEGIARREEAKKKMGWPSGVWVM